MKLKEYPVSLYQSLKLWLTPAQKLSDGARDLDLPLIISLTSIPSRLGILHLTIRSLLRQTVSAKEIVLWLNHDLENKVPTRLSRLQSNRFSIRFADQTCAHRKLVHALKAFPNNIVVTCDDDLLYQANWLELLVAEHRLYPRDIIGHECRRIEHTENGTAKPYKEWQSENPGNTNRHTLPIGYGGTLYPVGSIHPDVNLADQYLALAPKADDLWFKAMSLRQGTRSRRSLHPPKKPIPIVRSQSVRLGDTNIKADGNRLQWQALLDAYPEIRPVASPDLASGK